jgi:glycosyltransferase 2 family protein
MVKLKWTDFIKYFLILMGLGVLFFFIKSLKLETIKLTLSQLVYGDIVMVLLLTLVIVLIKGLRWKFLIRETTKTDISASFAIGSVLAGFAAGTLTPGRGGEIAKPLMAKATYGISLSRSISVVFIEKMLELSATVILSIAAIALLGGTVIGKTYPVITFAVLILVFIILLVRFTQMMNKFSKFIFRKIIFIESVRKKVLKLIDVFFTSLGVLKRKKVLALFTSLSVFSDLLEVLKLYFILNVLGVNIPFVYVLFALEASILFALLTMVPGGIGVTEVAQVQVITLLGVVKGQLAKTGILIDRFLSYYLLIFLGMIILFFYEWIYKKEMKWQQKEVEQSR